MSKNRSCVGRKYISCLLCSVHPVAANVAGALKGSCGRRETEVVLLLFRFLSYSQRYLLHSSRHLRSYVYSMGTKHKLGLQIGQVDQGLSRGVWLSYWVLLHSKLDPGIVSGYKCLFLLLQDDTIPAMRNLQPLSPTNLCWYFLKRGNEILITSFTGNFIFVFVSFPSTFRAHHEVFLYPMKTQE